jgi:hypothetical protein
MVLNCVNEGTSSLLTWFIKHSAMKTWADEGMDSSFLTSVAAESEWSASSPGKEP